MNSTSGRYVRRGCVGESTPVFSLSFVVSLVDPASSPSDLSRALAPTATLKVLMMPHWLKSYRTEKVHAPSMSSNRVGLGGGGREEVEGGEGERQIPQGIFQMSVYLTVEAML